MQLSVVVLLWVPEYWLLSGLYEEDKQRGDACTSSNFKPKTLPISWLAHSQRGAAFMYT